MIKLLYICRYFAPDNSVASIRSTKFAKYLAKTGKYSVDVLKLERTAKLDDELLSNDLQYINKVYYAPANDSTQMQRSTQGNWLTRKLGSLREISQDFKQVKKHANQVFDWAKREMDLDAYDVIISSSGPFITHVIASKIKEACPHSVWIADYRDPEVYAISNNRLVQSWGRSFDKRTTKQADHIIGATKSCFQNMGIYADANCTELLNGYDEEDLAYILRASAPVPNAGKFSLSYTGTLYPKLSNVSVVFRALRQLIDEGEVDEDKIEIRYAGRMPELFEAQVRPHGFRTIQNYGYVPREKSIEIQLGSNLLLLASFDVGLKTSIVTGKFYEYLMTKRPIVCTVSGTGKNTRLHQMIGEANCGVCWEEANDDEDYPRLKEFLRDQYRMFVEKGENACDCHGDVIEQYSYRSLTKKLDDLIQSKIRM